MRYQAKAIGSGSDSAQSALQEAYKPDMTFKEAEVLALATLKQVMEEKVSAAGGDAAGWAGRCSRGGQGRAFRLWLPGTLLKPPSAPCAPRR